LRGSAGLFWQIGTRTFVSGNIALPHRAAAIACTTYDPLTNHKQPKTAAMARDLLGLMVENNEKYYG